MNAQTDSQDTPLQPACGAREPAERLYRCTLPEGHDGDHAAETADGTVAATWTQDGAS